MNEQALLPIYQDDAPEVGHTLTITNPADPNNPRVYHNIECLTSYHDHLKILRAGDTDRSTVVLNRGDVTSFDDISSERINDPMYAIGIQHRPGEMGMTHGPTPNFDEMLAVVPADYKCLLLQFDTDGTEKVIRVAGRTDSGVLEWQSPALWGGKESEVDADGPQCPPACLSAYSHAEGCEHYIDPDDDFDVPF